METTETEQEQPKIEKFVWDITYACPLRCVHCYSESGRRPSRALGRDDMHRVIDAIIGAQPKGVSFAGGEPLVVSWWGEAARRCSEAGIPVTLSTSGWLMDAEIATELADSVEHLVVSIDGGTEETNDSIRGREGAFKNSMKALEFLTETKRERAASGDRCFTLGIDYTVTRRGKNELEMFVTNMTSRFPELDYVTFGAAVPCGLAEEENFCELLTEEELDALAGAKTRLASLSKSSTCIDVTDVRHFRPDSALSVAGNTHAHLEPDGQLRAFATYEAKVGNILEVPVAQLWQRALDWRNDPFVSEQRNSIRSTEDWARVGRLLDQRYGSEADLIRISRRREVR